MKKWILIFVFFSLLITFFTSCDNQLVKDSAFRRAGKISENHGSKKNITLVCWNVETFFDAVTVGTEYQEFKNSERWNQEKYQKRLNKLCEVMTSLNPNIFVMEEIENEEVVQDIANNLAASSWDSKKNWQYVCFAKETGSAIGCAVFSRYELEKLLLHSLDIRTQSEAQPSSRPIMQLIVCVGSQEVNLFVNHWKSKSGGEEETEIWRDWQEMVLADNIPDEMPLVICGDFNRSAEDFILTASHNSINNTLLRGSNKSQETFSPWFRSDGKFATEGGSYYYSGSWERIDNILVSGGVNVSSFSPVTDPPLADEEGIPVSYKVFTGEGCSDHLPLKCVISIPYD